MTSVETPEADVTTTDDPADPAPHVDRRDIWHPLTFRERLTIAPVIQDVWFALAYVTRMRHRLRCPSCKAVGTWKMHGSVLERWFFKDINTRRWLCKWCGHYINPTGRTVAFPDMAGLKVWRFPEDGLERQPTPAESCAEHNGAWPWHG